MTDNTDLGAVMLIAIVFTFVAFLLIFVISDAIKTARINREWARKIAKERARQAPMWRSVTTTVNRPVPTPSTSGKTRESGRSETKVATSGSPSRSSVASLYGDAQRRTVQLHSDLG